jgi:hypothetical protein
MTCEQETILHALREALAESRFSHVHVYFIKLSDYHKVPLTFSLLTYLLTPWSRVLLEKLTGFAVSQEIPRIYGTRKFITILTSARHLSLS